MVLGKDLAILLNRSCIDRSSWLHAGVVESWLKQPGRVELTQDPISVDMRKLVGTATW